MELGELATVVTRLSIGAIATFLSILLWSNTRDAAWMLVVLGVIVQYAGILYGTFERFGIVPADITLYGVPFLTIIFENLPLLLLGAAFLVVLSRNRMH